MKLIYKSIIINKYIEYISVKIFVFFLTELVKNKIK